MTKRQTLGLHLYKVTRVVKLTETEGGMGAGEDGKYLGVDGAECNNALACTLKNASDGKFCYVYFTAINNLILN